MPKKIEHSFEKLFKPSIESQQYKMDTTDEKVLEQKPDHDGGEK